MNKNLKKIILFLVIPFVLLAAKDRSFFDITKEFSKQYDISIFPGDKISVYDEETKLLHIMEYVGLNHKSDGSSYYDHNIIISESMSKEQYNKLFNTNALVLKGDVYSKIANKMQSEFAEKDVHEGFFDQLKGELSSAHKKAVSNGVKSGISYAANKILMDQSFSKEERKRISNELNQQRNSIEKEITKKLILEISIEASLQNLTNLSNSNSEINIKILESSKIDLMLNSPILKSDNIDFKNTAESLFYRAQSEFNNNQITENHLKFSNMMISEADTLEISGDGEQAYNYLEIVKESLDVIAGAVPISAFVADLYTVVTGELLISGKKISNTERIVAAVSVLTLGNLGTIKNTFKILKRLIKVFSKNKRFISDDIPELLSLMSTILKNINRGAQNTKELLIGIKELELNYKQIKKIMNNSFLLKRKSYISFKPNTLRPHFEKHSSQVALALGKKLYNLEDYLSDAIYIIKNGSYIPELNGYIKLIGAKVGTKANSNFGFVGLDDFGNITSFHIKSRKDLERVIKSDFFN